MPTVATYNQSGVKVGEIQLNDAVFGVEVNEAVMHQAVVRQLSNERLGTHATKLEVWFVAVAANLGNKKVLAVHVQAPAVPQSGSVVVLHLVHNLAAITKLCLVRLDV